jgi:hypothetical protein
VDVPGRQTLIRRNRVDVFLTVTLKFPELPTWESQMDPAERQKGIGDRKKAVARTFNWVE